LQRHEKIDTPAVIAVTFQAGDDTVRWVLGVLANERVKHGYDAEYEDRAEPPKQAQTSRLHEANGKKWKHRDSQA